MYLSKSFFCIFDVKWYTSVIHKACSVQFRSIFNEAAVCQCLWGLLSIRPAAGHLAAETTSRQQFSFRQRRFHHLFHSWVCLRADDWVDETHETALGSSKLDSKIGNAACLSALARASRVDVEQLPCPLHPFFFFLYLFSQRESQLNCSWLFGE